VLKKEKYIINFRIYTCPASKTPRQNYRTSEMFMLLVLEHWWIKLLCLHSGLPSHWGPKIRHKTRPAQQQNNKNNKPDWKKNQTNQRQP